MQEIIFALQPALECFTGKPSHWLRLGRLKVSHDNCWCLAYSFLVDPWNVTFVENTLIKGHPGHHPGQTYTILLSSTTVKLFDKKSLNILCIGVLNLSVLREITFAVGKSLFYMHVVFGCNNFVHLARYLSCRDYFLKSLKVFYSFRIRSLFASYFSAHKKSSTLWAYVTENDPWKWLVFFWIRISITEKYFFPCGTYQRTGPETKAKIWIFKLKADTLLIYNTFEKGSANKD